MAYLATWIIPLAIVRLYWGLTHNLPTSMALMLITTVLMLAGYSKLRKPRKN